MPIPFIIAGVAVAAGAYGVKKGLDAKDDYNTAEKVNAKAKRIFDEAKDSLEVARAETNDYLKQLGTFKFNTYKKLIIPFLEEFDKIKNLDNSVKVNGEIVELPSQDTMQKMKEHRLELQELVGGGLTSLGSGGLAGLAAYGSVGALATASTGTAIGSLSGVAATNATLAWLGGGSLASGGLGMAGGTAVLGGIVAGPVLAVGGMILASKAEEAKEDAYSNLETAKLQAEEIKTAQIKTESIGKKIVELNSVLSKISFLFMKASFDLVRTCQTHGYNYKTYPKEVKQSIGIAKKLYDTTDNLLDVALLDEKGNLNNRINEIIESANERLK